MGFYSGGIYLLNDSIQYYKRKNPPSRQGREVVASPFFTVVPFGFPLIASHRRRGPLPLMGGAPLPRCGTRSFHSHPCRVVVTAGYQQSPSPLLPVSTLRAAACGGGWGCGGGSGSLFVDVILGWGSCSGGCLVVLILVSSSLLLLLLLLGGGLSSPSPLSLSLSYPCPVVALRFHPASSCSRW
jgi:hypothetical protein